ncbi:M20/M25/M40 family metallo-hydrolase, partial [Clostridium saudiense]|nr:M20/M25/M40 family metallo-hydrolase [Clostridium saudiense]
PNGVNTRSTEIDGLVESSTNLGVLSTGEDYVEFDSAVRSSVPSLKKEIESRIKTITEILGAEFSSKSDYPGWEYNPNSKMREICQKVYKDMTGKEAKIVAIHAGVECGLFNEKLGNLDMISFGPNLYDVHTPQEHMSITSVKNTWDYLLKVLEEIK